MMTVKAVVKGVFDVLEAILLASVIVAISLLQVVFYLLLSPVVVVIDLWLWSHGDIEDAFELELFQLWSSVALVDILLQKRDNYVA